MGEEKTIGGRIAKLRRDMKLSQFELAEKLDISDKAVSKWELDLSVPYIDNILVLSKIFGVSTDYILKGEEEEKPTKVCNLIEVCKLKKVTVDGNVLGKFGTFTIGQEFENTTNEIAEVFYTFPISDTAAVYDFRAYVGDKELVGKVFEKKEAKENYQKALTEGNSAYLMENEQGNSFKIAIGKIAPNENVKIKISYIDNFEIFNNNLSVRIPTVIAPRYNDAVTAKQEYETEIGYNADFNIVFAKELKIKDINSNTHAIKTDGNKVTCKNTKLNRDFVLDIVLGTEQQSIGYRNGEFIFLQFMPEIKENKSHTPKHYVFIVDCSGSMRGQKIEKSKKAILKSLGQLTNKDTFQIIVFGSEYNDLTGIMSATKSELQKIKTVVENIDANLGGTEIFEPLKYAVKDKDDQTILLFTDGQVGNETEIAVFLRANISRNQLFILGIDDAVNSDCLKKLAAAGNGKAEFLALGDDLDERILRQFARINSASVAEVKLNYGQNKVLDSLPFEKVLFNHEYWQAVLKMKDLVDSIKIELSMPVGKEVLEIKKEQVVETAVRLSQVFASQKIKQIQKQIDDNRYDSSVDGYKKQIVKLACEYGVNSTETSFLIVNERGDKLFDNAVQQQVKLEEPSSWGAMRACLPMPIMEQVVRLPLPVHAPRKPVQQRPEEFDLNAFFEPEDFAPAFQKSNSAEDKDPLFVEVLRYAVRDGNTKKTISIAEVQRVFSVGLGRAGRIIDQLADAGYISKANGGKPRKVLVTKEQVTALYGE